ncbi:MAG TPA: enoyl-CoA hydratase/isomerase family protein [Pseudolabrys sp.]|nr:enoyl-CoA hydratase/isomerase family protein [Pseudolabrys sp.]
MSEQAAAADEGTVHVTIDGAIARVTFDRPQAHNAMTWSMYQQLEAICARLRADGNVRAAAFTGAGGKAFIAGTDIAQFRDFDADKGVAYEQKIAQFVAAVESLPMPTLAVVEGWCVGGGLAIATACDLRIATPAARFGVPIARTLGNCLNAGVYARLLAEFGVGRTKRMLMLAEMLTAEEAREAGYVSLIVEPGELAARAGELLAKLAQHAPITMQVGKQAIARLLAAVAVEDEDLVRRAYRSEDFREGVAAFTEKRKPDWKGR